MDEIKLKSLCDEVLITLNNLRDCEVEESEGSVSVTFGKAPKKTGLDEESFGEDSGSGE